MPARQVYTFTGATMGTTYTLKVVGTDISVEDQHRIQDTVDSRLQVITDLMSTWDAKSELSRFNAWNKTEPFPVSEELLEVLTQAQRISVASEGAFDVTVGPLVNMWGFGATEEDRAETPSEESIVKARRQVGYQKLIIDSQAKTIRKELPMMYVDLSAIAPGYGADYVALAIESMGYGEYMLEVGGEVRTRGKNGQGQWWQIAIEKPVPEERAMYRVVPVANMSLATSGDYRDFIIKDGARLSHTIDPTTGHPVNHALVSATVLHEECGMADGYATALMVLGPEKGLALAERLGLAVFLIAHDGQGGFVDYESKAFAHYIATTARE